jgi:outer membrane receptor protein involved in Fe transport
MFNDNGNIHEAVAIDPFSIANLFINYTLQGSSRLAQSRLRFAINNLTDNHAITGVDQVEPAGAWRCVDADVGPQRDGVADGRTLAGASVAVAAIASEGRDSAPAPRSDSPRSGRRCFPSR